MAAPRNGDGDASHIAMKSIRMRAESQSVKLIVMLNQIKANYDWLPLGGAEIQLAECHGDVIFQGRKASLRVSLHLT